MALNNQFKPPNSIVTNTEYQEVINNINYLDERSTLALDRLDILNAKADAFKPTAGSGLAVAIAPGTLKRVSDGDLLNYAGGTVFVAPNATNHYVYIDRTGVAVSSATPPIESYDIGRVSSNATVITSIVDTRSNAFEIKQRQFRRVVQANKNTLQNIPGGGAFSVIGDWQTSQAWQYNEGGNLSGTGYFTIPKTTQYKIFARVFLEATAPTDLSAKLSLFVGAVELRILEEKPTNTSALRTTLSGWHQDTFTAADQMTLRVAVGSGSNVRAPATVNSEWIIEQLG